MACLAAAQAVCTHPGQTPVSAIMICGTETINMRTPTFCGMMAVPVPCGDGFPYRNTNPNFFRMACYSSGTLGFTITPEDPAADYNWQLFDITSINPDDIFTNPGLFLACNWSSDPGETGASSVGTSLSVCSGPNPLFSSMPDLVQGHTYLLMVANQTGFNSGYELNINGGTASVTDPADPRMVIVTPSCNGTSLLVRMNKKITCGSVAADGSDFTLSNGISVIAAAPADCAVLGSDSIYLTLDQPLSNGTYTLTVKTGTDANTIADVCGKIISTGEFIRFTVNALQPTALDSVYVTGCSPSWVDLVFKKPIRCATIARDASDFRITGPQAVNLALAGKTLTACTGNGLVSVIRLDITTPLTTGGMYTIQLLQGSDGNTIIDECGITTPAGDDVPFRINDPVSARFTYTIPPSCTLSPVKFEHDGNGSTLNWHWTFAGNGSSGQQNPVITFPHPGNYKVQLIAANASCADTTEQTITVPGVLNADFTAPAMLCPGDTLHADNRTTGIADQWNWDFGNGDKSTLRDPAVIRYLAIGRDNYYTIRLIASNSSLHCGDTVSKVVNVLSNCTIGVPTAFTPNGDGRNDYLYPLNALKADDLQFTVYNRIGQMVFTTKDWTRKWDGRINGVLQQTGVYAWVLRYRHRDTGQTVFMKGTTLLLR